MANKSSTDECVKMLKRYITDYDKGKIKDYFDDLLQKLEIAKINAAKLRTELQSTSSVNPATDLDLLIQRMENNFLSEE